MARPVSARLIALDVLDRVLGEARPLEETFAGHPALALLDPRDRAFARLLAATVLRRLGQIDALLDQLMRARPKAVRVHNLLRLGAAQLCSSKPGTLRSPRPWRWPAAHTITPRAWSTLCCGGSRAKARRLWRWTPPAEHAGLAVGELATAASRPRMPWPQPISPSRRSISP